LQHPLDDIVPLLPEIADNANFDQRAASAAMLALAAQRVSISSDEGFYTVIVFQTKPQLQEFLHRTGWELEHDGYWIDGFKLADKLGIDIKPIDPEVMQRVYDRVKTTKQETDAIARGLEFFPIESLQRKKKKK